MVRRRTSPGVQADADVDGPTGRRPDVRQHPQRGVGGAHGVVLMGHRRAEQCQDAVAHDRADGAVEGVHGRRHGVDHRLQARDRDLRIDVGDQPRGTDGVREQQRHELACARHARGAVVPRGGARSMPLRTRRSTGRRGVRVCRSSGTCRSVWQMQAERWNPVQRVHLRAVVPQHAFRAVGWQARELDPHLFIGSAPSTPPGRRPWWNAHHAPVTGGDEMVTSKRRLAAALTALTMTTTPDQRAAWRRTHDTPCRPAAPRDRH